MSKLQVSRPTVFLWKTVFVFFANIVVQHRCILGVISTKLSFFKILGTIKKTK